MQAPEIGTIRAALESQKTLLEERLGRIKDNVRRGFNADSGEMAKELEDQIGPYSVIAQDGDRFLVLLPEESKRDIPGLTAQVRARVHESMGLELRIGTATLPEVETFDELVETAYAEMKRTERKTRNTGVLLTKN